MCEVVWCANTVCVGRMGLGKYAWSGYGVRSWGGGKRIACG